MCPFPGRSAYTVCTCSSASPQPVVSVKLSYSIALFFALVNVACGPTSAWAGAWLREPGGWYAKSTLLAHATRDRWDHQGATTSAEPFGGRYREFHVHQYVEWGASRRLTLVGSFGVKDARIEDAVVPDYGTRSTTDLRIGGRFGLSRGGWPLSLEGSLALPTYDRTDPTLPIGERPQFLPAGNGRAEAEVRVLLGRSLHPIPLYVNLDAGHRFRGGGFGDQWLLAAEAGGTWKRLFAKAELRGTLPTGELRTGSSAGTVSLQERSWRIGPEIALRLGANSWVGLGAAVPFASRNALQGTQWAVSLAWRRMGER
jgi:hypothetical protein